MFESWPFTNFHDLNLDWIIKTVKEWTKTMDNVRNDIYKFMQSDFREAIEDIIIKHPEWVTTVTDHSITLRKLAADVLNRLDDVPYYHNITLTEHRANDTDYYICKIPENDANGNTIGLYLSYDPDKNPLQQADETGTNVTINGGCSYRLDGSWVHGIMIANGEVMTESVIPGQSLQGRAECVDGWYIGITDDREIKEYSVNSSVTAQDMLNDGCKNVFNAYFKLVENGQVADLSQITWGDANNPDNRNPLMVLGVKANNEIVFISCDGRTPINKGMNYQEMGQILINEGCVTGYNLDGGGSACMVYRGAKINRDIDEDGTAIRLINYTINVKCPDGSETSRKDFAQVGIEKQRLIKQIVSYVNQTAISNKTSNRISSGDNLDDFITPGKYTCPNASEAGGVINSPVTSEGFELYVMSQGANVAVYQFITSNDGVTRFYRFVDQTAGPWYRQGHTPPTIWGYELNTHGIAATDQYEQMSIGAGSVQGNTTNAIVSNIMNITENINSVTFKQEGTVKFTYTCNFYASGTGEKYIRIVRNRAGNASNRATQKTTIQQGNTANMCANATFNVEAGDTVYYLCYGQAGDQVEQGHMDFVFTPNYMGGNRY